MSMYGQVYTRGLRAHVPMHEGSNCCGRRLWDRAVSMSYDWKTCLALGGALKARSEEHSLVNAKWAWSEVRIGLGDTFGLIGRLRHRDRRRPRRGRRAVHQGQHRPPSGRSEVRQIRTGTRLFEPASPGCLGARAFLCRRGETARARNSRQTSPSYWPCRSLGRGTAKYCAPSRLAIDACGTLCGQPVGQSRAPDICKEARQACMGSEARMSCEGPYT